MEPFLCPPVRTFRMRSITTHLYRGAVVVLLLASLVALVRRDHPVRRARADHEIINVSRSALGDSFAEVLGLGRGERVVAVDGAPATTDQAIDAWRATEPGGFLDLTVADRRGDTHHVFVLVSP